MIEEDAEAGLEGTTDWEDGDKVATIDGGGSWGMKEQRGNGGNGPQRPPLPAKDLMPNFACIPSGTLPDSWLLEALNSTSRGNAVDRSGRRPERRLSCTRKVRSRVKLAMAPPGMVPRRLLLERSMRRRRVNWPMTGGISPEKSLWDR